MDANLKEKADFMWDYPEMGIFIAGQSEEKGNEKYVEFPYSKGIHKGDVLTVKSHSKTYMDKL